jgi:hypothetical protein
MTIERIDEERAREIREWTRAYREAVADGASKGVAEIYADHVIGVLGHATQRDLDADFAYKARRREEASDDD